MQLVFFLSGLCCLAGSANALSFPGYAGKMVSFIDCQPPHSLPPVLSSGYSHQPHGFLPPGVQKILSGSSSLNLRPFIPSHSLDLYVEVCDLVCLPQFSTNVLLFAWKKVCWVSTNGIGCCQWFFYSAICSNVLLGCALFVNSCAYVCIGMVFAFKEYPTTTYFVLFVFDGLLWVAFHPMPILNFLFIGLHLISTFGLLSHRPYDAQLPQQAGNVSNRFLMFRRGRPQPG
jgi:hypothetical protein